MTLWAFGFAFIFTSSHFRLPDRYPSWHFACLSFSLAALFSFSTDRLSFVFGPEVKEKWKKHEKYLLEVVEKLKPTKFMFLNYRVVSVDSTLIILYNIIFLYLGWFFVLILFSHFCGYLLSSSRCWFPWPGCCHTVPVLLGKLTRKVEYKLRQSGHLISSLLISDPNLRLCPRYDGLYL